MVGHPSSVSKCTERTNVEDTSRPSWLSQNSPALQVKGPKKYQCIAMRNIL